MNRQYLSIKPDLQIHAQHIATQRSKTFKNWQAVIYLAIDYGLPLVGHTQEREQAKETKADLKKYVRKTNRQHSKYYKTRQQGYATKIRTCKHTGLKTECSPDIQCRNCNNLPK